MATVLGVRLERDWMAAGFGIRPEVSLAWMHEWDDTRQAVDMSFASAPDGADFTVVSAETARDSALVGIGAALDITERMDVRVDYDGRFNEDYTSHTVSGRLTSRW